MMGDFSAIVLGEYVEHTMSLEILDLSWNRITSFGGAKLFEGLRPCQSIRSVNISYNLLGNSNNFNFVEACQCVINEDNLKHLDLSYNKMSKMLCEKLGMLIYDNHTLYGIHMEGNSCYVDKFGFINVDDKSQCSEHSKQTIIYPKSKNGYSTTIKFSKKNKLKYAPKVNCWVCEGWTENTFTFKLGDSYHEIEEPVHIHFDYHGFKPELMRGRNDSEYTITTM